MKRCRQVFLRTILLASVCWVLVAPMGCGSSGPTRYRLEGEITYDGKPVPAGEIFLEPDTSQGNSGPGGHAIIEDGRYATVSGKGTVGGPHILRVEGTDGEASWEAPYGGYLFDEFVVSVDLPEEDTTYDIVVPAE